MTKNNVTLLVRSLLEAFGSLWLVTEIVAFFSDPASTKIRSYWWLFFLFGMALTVYRAWPKKRFSCKLDNRDVCLEIVIGDLFEQKGSLIIGSNTNFTTNPNEISPKSVQGIYQKKYFPSGTQALDAQIRQIIPVIPAAIGTTALVRHTDRDAYLCAIATIGENGVAKSSIEELREALASLWNFIGNSGEKDTLNIPILGSGFSRINLSRESLVKEIVRSFVAATSEIPFCDALRIVIHPDDHNKFDINVPELVEFVQYTCRHAISPPSSERAGRPEV